jgi:hypothetical protein
VLTQSDAFGLVSMTAPQFAEGTLAVTGFDFPFNNTRVLVYSESVTGPWQLQDAGVY